MSTFVVSCVAIFILGSCSLTGVDAGGMPGGGAVARQMKSAVQDAQQKTGFKFESIDPAYTPFFPNASLNTAVIPQMANFSAAMGSSVVLVGGSTANWPSMTVAERIAEGKAWAPAARQHGLTFLFHVGHTDLSSAKELAQAGEEMEADMLLMVAPCIIRPGTVGELVSWMAEVAAEAPKTPILYYHFPGLYTVDFPMDEFVPAAIKGVPTFAGVKYIDQQMSDFTLASGAAMATNGKVVMYPMSHLALSTMPLGAGGSPCDAVQAPLLNNVTAHYAKGDMAGAAAAQIRLEQFGKVVGAGGFTGNVGRAIMSLESGIDLGPPRAPNVATPRSQYAAIEATLRAAGYWFGA